MIERKFVKAQVKEVLIEEFVSDTLKNVGLSAVKMTRTPLGEKIIIFASRPGLVVGRKGENIKKLTQVIKKRFELENPQIELAEVGDPNLDARIVAERIASTLERFGSQKFKAVGHKTIQDVMAAGALGIEIVISGKIPGARAKSWRFYSGYMKKSGQIAIDGVLHANTFATLKAGTIGIKVSIMPPDIVLPDHIQVVAVEAEAPKVEEPEAPKKKHATRKKADGDAPKKKRAPRKKKEKPAEAPKEEPAKATKEESAKEQPAEVSKEEPDKEEPAEAENEAQ